MKKLLTADRKISMDLIIFEREPGHWVAQGLQYDIGAQATTCPIFSTRPGKRLWGMS